MAQDEARGGGRRRTPLGPAKALTGIPGLDRITHGGLPRGRLTLLALTLGSGVAILDGSIVNIALRTIGGELNASLAELSWVVNGYLLSLASLVLVGGALGVRLGRRRV